MAELGDGELVGAERCRERRVLELRAGTFETIPEDLAVVEGKAIRAGQ